MSLHVVLDHPEIRWNTGNAGRTCLATGVTLHLIEPLGFSLDQREVKRAGLDYWEHLDVRVWPSWEAFEAVLPTHQRFADRFVTMPMHSPRVRSLNLSSSVAIAVYEVLRQMREAGR